MIQQRINPEFFQRDVLDVAPELLGMQIVRDFGNGLVKAYAITEVEAYRGEDDLACHASKGRTRRTEVMYANGGCLYVYLIYGMYWMLNVVTGKVNSPQAVLIRGVEGCYGPGKLTRQLQIDNSFYGEDLHTSSRIWIAGNNCNPTIKCGPRIGVDYSGPVWAQKPWRFWL